MIPLADSVRPVAADAGAPLRLALNIPAYRLDVIERGVPTRSYTVAVGLPDHVTPLGEFAVTRVVWNPWWVPPDVEWAKAERPTPPGPLNPMGRVKLEFDSLYYLHGTPERPLGVAASHGCARLTNDDAVALATVVHLYASPDLGPIELLELARDTATRTVTLERPVPLTVRYDVAEVRHDSLLVHGDPYGRARDGRFAEAVRALARAGYDVGLLDLAGLDAALAATAGGPLHLPLAALRRETNAHDR